ncbi:uncharacterized protein LOC135398834 isoform X2 [Ornithodoros turicata]|uniref:uncharacterized protein LOC135398834 isoform X2 n=1 Tax=Ornithodoros turicata TaxID=34597 RepID=UPI00313A30F6
MEAKTDTRPSTAAAMARNMQVGQLEPFDESTSDWPAYEERLLAYIQVNHIEDADKVYALFSIVGAKTYGLLKSLCSPDKPTSKTFDAVLKLLRAHFTPEPSVIGERAKFHRRTQRDNESITEFVASLRKLAETCDFGLFLDESLRDRFVCGLQRVEIQRVLFTEDKKLSFQKAVDKALALENASKNATATHAKYESPGDLFKIQAEKTRSGLSAECSRCASAKHASLSCPFINATCYQCNKKGHIRRACKSRARKRYQGGKPIPKRYDAVRTLSIPIKGIQDGKSDPIGVTMTVNGIPLTMELDTGAAVSVISAHDFKATFGYGQFQKTDLKLRTYTGEEVAPLGVVQVQVQYNNQAASLPLYVVHQPGPPLLGRQWLRCIRLDWPSLCNFCRVSVPQDTAKDVKRKLNLLLDKYGAIFKDELGTVKAPGIFQRIMENVLKGSPKVCCYLDDLLITGSTPEEHLANLDAVLKRLLCNKATWLWSPECEHSFNKIKEVITTAPVLAHYSSYLPLQLAGDASPYGVQPAPPKSPLHPWSWPTAPWHRLHADFAGPFKGHMFLIVMDAHSKWPEVFIMGKTTTKHTIEKLHELFSRFGIPESFVTDNGP